MTAEAAAETARALVDGVEGVVRGRREAVELLVCAALAGGHVLIEDVPGSGKTTLARALAASLGAPFARVQATTDLLPADITGSGVWDAGAREFRFVPGPLFANVVLVDEINRASPRTQSAFLEAMSEGAVTADGVRHPLPEPFWLLATQNPVEQHGTWELPEAQLDRFAVRVTLGPLPTEVELRVLREQLAGASPEALPAVLDPHGLRELRELTARVHVADAVLQHTLALVAATREDPRVLLGASTRAAIALVRLAQARAVLHGRDHVAPEDVLAVVVPALAHRLVLSEGHDGDAGDAPLSARQRRVVDGVVQRVPVPVHR